MARIRSWVIALYSKVLKHYEWYEICSLVTVIVVKDSGKLLVVDCGQDNGF